MSEKFRGLEFGLQDLGQNMLDAVKMCAKHPVYTGFVLSFILSSCRAALPTPDNSSITPTAVSSEVGPELSFGVIPTAIAKESLSPGVYPTESYCSDDLRLCVFHQFDQEGKALAPRAYTNSQINFDLDNNAVIITGDPLIQDDKDVWIYPPHDGQEGYETVETMSVEEATAWMENMSEAGRGNMQTAIDEAKSKGVGVNILMKTVLNVQKNSEGKDRLVDMIGGLAVSSGEEGATIAQLNDTLEPLTENELLKDQQIAGVDFVPQFDGTEKLVMEVYPSDWIEVGGGSWVSPEFFELQSQIAASGERLTLLSDGTIQDGATTVPGLFVDKNGTITLQIGGKDSYVILRVESLSFDVTKGVNVAGYTLDRETGKWGVESPTITILNKFGVDPSTYTLTNVGGVIIGTNNETGAEISRDGRLEIGFAVELAKKDCESTDFVPDNTRAEGIKLPNSSGLYLESILMDTHYLESGPSSANFYTVLVDREKQCWAWADGRALLYRDSSGDAKVIKTIYLTEDEVFEFVLNR